jgi:hypothetical protein
MSINAAKSGLYGSYPSDTNAHNRLRHCVFTTNSRELHAVHFSWYLYNAYMPLQGIQYYMQHLSELPPKPPLRRCGCCLSPTTTSASQSPGMSRDSWHLFGATRTTERICLLLGLLLFQHQQELALARTVCKLNIEGYGAKQGIRHASLSCTGGSITASVHPKLFGAFSRTFTGAAWSGRYSCGALQSKCALTVCGDTTATFLNAAIIGVNVSSTVSDLLCAADSSDLLFQGARFVSNTGRVIHAVNQTVRLHFVSSLFQNNTAPWDESLGGALSAEAGWVLVQSSRFQGNRALTRTGGAAGAICMQGTSHLTLLSSKLQDNVGEQKGPAARRLPTTGPLAARMVQCRTLGWYTPRMQQPVALWLGNHTITQCKHTVQHHCA